MTIKDRYLKAAVDTILDKKGIRPVVLDLRGVSPLTDYFIIVSGTSSRQLKGLAEALDETLSAMRLSPLRTEGMSGGTWVLVDYGDFVVHIFEEATRSFYDLERLWRHVPAMPVGVGEETT